MAKSKQKDFGDWSNPNWKPGKGSYVSCYHSHPALEFTDPTTGVIYKIYGGNCATPVVNDADVYIGLTGMAVSGGIQPYPWEDGYKPVVIVDYPITDMQPPGNAESFHQLVDWTCNQLRSGKKVHVGCHGGHGRTGMVLVAVVATMTGMADAIKYVRDKYCVKAVETTGQVKFLVKEFGVKSAPEVKKFQSYPTSSTKPLTGNWDDFPKSNGYQGSSGSSTKVAPAGFTNAVRKFNAVSPSKKAIW